MYFVLFDIIWIAFLGGISGAFFYTGYLLRNLSKEPDRSLADRDRMAYLVLTLPFVIMGIGLHHMYPSLASVIEGYFAHLLALHTCMITAIVVLSTRDRAHFASMSDR